MPISQKIPASSMLVDMNLPRPIPAKTAIRMACTSIKTIMYMRGQMGSPWDQLEQMLQLEQFQEEDRLQPEDPCHVLMSSAAQAPAVRWNSAWNSDSTIPTKSLREFIQTGERMFVDLEESIYSQLYDHLRSSATYLPSSTLSSSSSTTPSTPKLFITLALIFGATISTPKEQYMIRIGPLEAQQTVCMNRSATTSLLQPSYSVPHSAADSGSIVEQSVRRSECHSSTTAENETRPQKEPDTDLNRPYTRAIEQHATFLEEQELHQRQDQKRGREEKTWERRLIQQIMGISSVSSDALPLQHSVTFANTPILSSPSPLPAGRSKGHLLMKARSGLVFQGMLPKQTIYLQEDYCLDDISAVNICQGPSGPGVGGGSMVQSPNLTGDVYKKTARWPIRHIHVLGPFSSSSPVPLSTSGHDSVVPALSHTDNTDSPVDEIWYQVGSGIPVLSPLL
ncbi:hypothetical protein EDD21DRAFT_57207 [Dissophora ornata]|nr:hypothetical protein EDD21DRAFT_57207 [Dissophora ornata]